MQTTDQKNIADVKAGNQRAFEKLFNAHHGPIQGYLGQQMKLMSGHNMNGYIIPEIGTIVSDLAIEVFAKAYECIMNGKYDNKQKYFRTWLYRVSKFHLIDWIRCTHKNSETYKLYRVDGKANHEYKEDWSTYGIHALRSDVCPLVKLERKEKKARIMEAFDKVNPRYLEVALLRFVEDLSYTEIAEQLKKPMNSVKAELFRVKKDLVANLDNKEFAMSY